MELDFKLFFFVVSLFLHLSLKNPSDATLASLSFLIYPRLHPRWRPIISEKNVIWKKLSQKHFLS